jgi:guanyl-specific ribonuclease Sa
MGGVTGQLGASLGQAISPYISNLTSGIGGQAVQQALTQSITGSVVGFTMGTGFSLLNGKSWSDTLKAGGQGALMGFGIGATTGLATGMRSAYKAGENSWTGKSKIEVTANDLGLSTTTTDRIDAGKSYPHKNDGSTFINKDGILPLQQSPDYYKEYVHPTPKVNGPGLQKVVIGGDKYYYSPDHYKTFIRFRH